MTRSLILVMSPVILALLIATTPDMPGGLGMTIGALIALPLAVGGWLLVSLTRASSLSVAAAGFFAAFILRFGSAAVVAMQFRESPAALSILVTLAACLFATLVIEKVLCYRASRSPAAGNGISPSEAAHA